MNQALWGHTGAVGKAGGREVPKAKSRGGGMEVGGCIAQRPLWERRVLHQRCRESSLAVQSRRQRGHDAGLQASRPTPQLCEVTQRTGTGHF